jgi:hypothetical protein
MLAVVVAPAHAASKAEAVTLGDVTRTRSCVAC